MKEVSTLPYLDEDEDEFDIDTHINEMSGFQYVLEQLKDYIKSISQTFKTAVGVEVERKEFETYVNNNKETDPTPRVNQQGVEHGGSMPPPAKRMKFAEHNDVDYASDQEEDDNDNDNEDEEEYDEWEDIL